MGCYEVSLGDTIGVATPNYIHTLMSFLKNNNFPMEKLAVHFHDTNNMAIENIKVALEYNIRTIDSSVGNLGGCPSAAQTSNNPLLNVSTLKVVETLDKLGYDTNIDLNKLKDAHIFATSFLNDN